MFYFCLQQQGRERFCSINSSSHNKMLSCTLLSTPVDKQVPPDEADGTVGVAKGAVQWIGSSGKRSSESFAVADIDSMYRNV